MNQHPLTPEQEREIEALQAELAHHLPRTGVDLSGIGPRLHQSHPAVERRTSDDEFELALTIDLSAIVNTLQQLPDGAGTEAFVAAYNQRR